MTKREIKKMVKSRAGLSNYSAITNIIWCKVRGNGALPDDIIYFEYKGCKYRLETRYANKYSMLPKHELVLLGETNS